MKVINAIKEIEFQNNEGIEFEASVLEIVTEGSQERKIPFRALVKLEGSGERTQVVSWTFEILNTIKEAVDTLDVLKFEGTGGKYRDDDQIRFSEVTITGKQSEKKILKLIDIDGLKRDFNALMNKYVSTELIRNMLDNLVMNNGDFFVWPAATRMHHNYKGGLATHTLQVVKNAITLWANYKGQNLDIEVIIAGAMLHDIGKLSEYNADGSRTDFGNLISHLVDGVERVTDFCAVNGVDANSNRKVLAIKHIILSHHEKLEYGAVVRPAILEAVVVAKADALDAVMESIYNELENTEPGEYTERVYAVEGNKFLKW